MLAARASEEVPQSGESDQAALAGTGASLDFSRGSVALSNLGGRGPDPGPPHLHCRSIGRCALGPVDMLATADPYSAHRPRMNGLTPGGFLRIQLAAGGKTALRLRFVVREGAAVALDAFALSVYDLSAGSGRRARHQSVVASGFERYQAGSDLQARGNPDGSTSFSAGPGLSTGEPIEPWVLTPEQLDRAACLHFAQASEVVLELAAAPGAGDASFLIACADPFRRTRAVGAAEDSGGQEGIVFLQQQWKEAVDEDDSEIYEWERQQDEIRRETQARIAAGLPVCRAVPAATVSPNRAAALQVEAQLTNARQKRETENMIQIQKLCSSALECCILGDMAQARSLADSCRCAGLDLETSGCRAAGLFLAALSAKLSQQSQATVDFYVSRMDEQAYKEAWTRAERLIEDQAKPQPGPVSRAPPAVLNQVSLPLRQQPRPDHQGPIYSRGRSPSAPRMRVRGPPPVPIPVVAPPPRIPQPRPSSAGRCTRSSSAPPMRPRGASMRRPGAFNPPPMHMTGARPSVLHRMRSVAYSAERIAAREGGRARW